MVGAGGQAEQRVADHDAGVIAGQTGELQPAALHQADGYAVAIAANGFHLGPLVQRHAVTAQAAAHHLRGIGIVLG